MERTMLSFNLPNIITVTVMGAIGYAALTLIAQLLMRSQGSGGAASSSLGGY